MLFLIQQLPPGAEYTYSGRGRRDLGIGEGLFYGLANLGESTNLLIFGPLLLLTLFRVVQTSRNTSDIHRLFRS